MESNQRFYWRRAAEEYYAAERAVTPAARSRRRQLADYYVRRLRESGVPGSVVSERLLATEQIRMFEWPLRERQPRSKAAADSLEWPLRAT